MRSRIIQLALERQWTEVFNLLEKEPPRIFDEVIHEYITRTRCDDFGDDFTDEQREKYRWLGSSERRIECYNKISDEEMTAEDWADLRSSAW